ncbi:hypothetical protein dsx2_2479 [Desulfovibrio sp. X2]|nr:hypothetical protein dsx2_2479 [Desulfovibrio sp. X2]
MSSRLTLVIRVDFKTRRVLAVFGGRRSRLAPAAPRAPLPAHLLRLTTGAATASQGGAQ